MTRRYSILVVDDDQESLGLLSEVLMARGYQVRPARSGTLAIESVILALPQLILLDIRLPDIDGFEVCRRLKADEKTRSVPLMFTSTLSDVEKCVEGLTLGAVDFVAKPFRLEELLARVRTHLESGLRSIQLEDQVAQRTAELRIANQRLQLELAEREQAQRVLRESHARFRDMADTAPVIIWGRDPENDVTYLNKFALSFSGRTLDQLTGKKWAELVHSDDLSRLNLTYTAPPNGRSSFQFEYRLRRADGQYRWVLETAIPRFLANGSFAGCIGNIVDITDIKRNQEQMPEIQKLEVLSVLTAGVAHDFNNLLGGILAESELALEDMPDSPARESMRRIAAAATYATEIVNRFMDYTDDNGDGTMLELVDLSLLTEDMLDLLKNSISKKATLVTKFSKELPAVPVNPTQIRRVIMNLFKNASDALGDTEGLITIGTSLAHIGGNAGEKDLADLPPGDYVRLEVSDTGRGLTEDARTKVFDPHFSTKSLGRGLGLTTVRGIVHSHHGAINIVSTAPKGTTFEILLPCAAKIDIQTGKPLLFQQSGSGSGA